MVNNHGDRFRPLRIGLDWTPSKWPNFMAFQGGLLTTNWDDPPSIAAFKSCLVGFLFTLILTFGWSLWKTGASTAVKRPTRRAPTIVISGVMGPL